MVSGCSSVDVVASKVHILGARHGRVEPPVRGFVVGAETVTLTSEKGTGYWPLLSTGRTATL